MKTLSEVIKPFWQFNRPYALIGSFIAGLSAMGLISVLTRDFTFSYLYYFFMGALCLFLASLGIVGFNQILDHPVDIQNKPYLPIAARQISLKTAWFLVIGADLLVVFISATQGIYLFSAMIISLVLGHLYSLSALRKTTAIFWLSSTLIAFIRGVIFNIFGFLYINQKLGFFDGVPTVIWLLAFATTCIAFALAWIKDISDVKGDEAYGYKNPATVLGVQKTFKIALAVLFTTFALMTWLFFVDVPYINTQVLAVGNLVMALVICRWVFAVDLNSFESAQNFYQVVWRFYYCENVLFFLSAVLAI